MLVHVETSFFFICHLFTDMSQANKIIDTNNFRVGWGSGNWFKKYLVSRLASKNYILLLQFTLLPTHSLSILKKTKQTKTTTKRKKKAKTKTNKQSSKQTNKQKTRRPRNENKSSPDNK